jgi:hypothetical protein
MSADPYLPPSAPVSDQSHASAIEVTWGRAAKVWWSLMWRGLLFGGLGGGLMGFIIGYVMATVGQTPQQIGVVTTWAGGLVAIPIGIWVVRNVLRKSWSDFRIALAPK